MLKRRKQVERKSKSIKLDEELLNELDVYAAFMVYTPAEIIEDAVWEVIRKNTEFQSDRDKFVREMATKSAKSDPESFSGDLPVAENAAPKRRRSKPEEQPEALAVSA